MNDNTIMKNRYPMGIISGFPKLLHILKVLRLLEFVDPLSQPRNFKNPRGSHESVVGLVCNDRKFFCASSSRIARYTLWNRRLSRYDPSLWGDETFDSFRLLRALTTFDRGEIS